MRSTRNIVALSIVAVLLTGGMIVCVISNPVTAVGLAPVLTAIAFIIRAISGGPSDPPTGG